MHEASNDLHDAIAQCVSKWATLNRVRATATEIEEAARCASDAAIGRLDGKQRATGVDAQSAFADKLSVMSASIWADANKDVIDPVQYGVGIALAYLSCSACLMPTNSASVVADSPVLDEILRSLRQLGAFLTDHETGSSPDRGWGSVEVHK